MIKNNTTSLYIEYLEDDFLNEITEFLTKRGFDFKVTNEYVVIEGSPNQLYRLLLTLSFDYDIELAYI